ncbi:MAG: hypothetical protein AAB263_03605 [Planctomycetota bacterium]
MTMSLIMVIATQTQDKYNSDVFASTLTVLRAAAELSGVGEHTGICPQQQYGSKPPTMVVTRRGAGYDQTAL